MRIYGNRKLKTIPGQETRPTTAKVREALFQIWQSKIIQSNWLDLCAGNGSMGAEALCRGAKLVIGIEQSSRACRLIRDNWSKLADKSQTFKILRGDVRSRLKTLEGQKFDLIYFDPPYASNLYQPVLTIIVKDQLLAQDGEIAVEYNPKIWQPSEIIGLEIIETKIYGNTNLTFYSLPRSLQQ
jgi:16S rRNA (guanine(966)-N(2))-methyltransferase RsmD